MDAHKGIISSIFNNVTLIEVPYFQRSYVWKEDLWQRFLDDMEHVVKTNSAHFFGSIILKAGRDPQPGDPFADCKIVVDGQQRLTTLLIFMKVLCLKTDQMTAFDMQFRLMGKSLALRHGKNDVDAFEKVMAAKEAREIDNPAPGSRIIEAFNFFVASIDTAKVSIMPILQNLQFVVIDLDKDEDEQQIFDTINSLGVSLTTSELLKNYFFSRDTLQDYEGVWAPAFEKDEDTKAYWDTELEVGRLKRAMIDIFFDAYFQIFIQDRRYRVSSYDKQLYGRSDHLAQSYRHFIEHYCDGSKKAVLGSLRDYAQCFMETFQADQCGQAVPSGSGIERMNVIIFGLKTTTLIPYVLYVAKNVPDQAKRGEMYGILESYIMRRMVVGATTKNYNRLFTSFILNRVLDPDALRSRLRGASATTTYIPSDEELREGFIGSKLANLQAKGVLYLIESKIRPETSSVALLGFNQYTLEHLMPRNWRNHWPPCATDELASQRDSALLTLGNLAIITQSLNVSIRDAEWSLKKSGNGPRRPGLDLCASGLCTLRDALKRKEWTEAEITKRAEWLSRQACAIWKI